MKLLSIDGHALSFASAGTGCLTDGGVRTILRIEPVNSTDDRDHHQQCQAHPSGAKPSSTLIAV
jgi:hypothetical protein